MNTTDIKARIAAIKQIADDAPAAHAAQDALARDVLHAIASGADDPRALATAVMKVYKIPFMRWFD